MGNRSLRKQKSWQLLSFRLSFNWTVRGINCWSCIWLCVDGLPNQFVRFSGELYKMVREWVVWRIVLKQIEKKHTKTRHRLVKNVPKYHQICRNCHIYKLNTDEQHKKSEYSQESRSNFGSFVANNSPNNSFANCIWLTHSVI